MIGKGIMRIRILQQQCIWKYEHYTASIVTHPFFGFYDPRVELKGSFSGGYGRISKEYDPVLEKEIDKIEYYQDHDVDYYL